MEILNEMIKYPGSNSGWVRIIDSREREAVKAAMLRGTISYHSYSGTYRHYFDKHRFTHEYALNALEKVARSTWNLVPFAYVYLPEKNAGCYEALAMVDNLIIQVVSFFCPPLKLASQVFGESTEMNERNLDSLMAMAARNAVKARKPAAKKVPDGSVTDGNILSDTEAINMFKGNTLIRGVGKDPRTKLDIADCYVLYDEQREYSVLERAYGSVINIYGRANYEKAKENSIKIITTAMDQFDRDNEPFDANAPVVGEQLEIPVDESVKYNSFIEYINKNS